MSVAPDLATWSLDPEERSVAFKMSGADIELLTLAASPDGAEVTTSSPLVRRLLAIGFIRVAESRGARIVARITRAGFRGVGFWTRRRIVTVGLGKSP
jgi:hypothetical protein